MYNRSSNFSNNCNSSSSNSRSCNNSNSIITKKGNIHNNSSSNSSSNNNSGLDNSVPIRRKEEMWPDTELDYYNVQHDVYDSLKVDT